jgi:3-dehydroquinate synthetase/shikimate kinase
VTPSSNIVLTGFMGTGKTTVGRLLADRLGKRFVDTDGLIEQRHGPIPRIFGDHGEARFREIERLVAAELADESDLVIATGGKMMLDPANIATLGRSGRVFCLVATVDEILERVVAGDDPAVERPLLAVPDPRRRIVGLLAERAPEYRRFAQVITDGRAPDAIVDDLAGLATTGPRHFAVTTTTGEFRYVVGTAVLPFVRELASIKGPIVVITAAEQRRLHAPLLPEADVVVELPSSPPVHRHRAADLSVMQGVYDRLIEAGVDRSATVVSLGDSIVCDIAGFVAATHRRGLGLVHCPTDLTAIIETSVGAEVGLHPPRRPNRIGLLQQPTAVVADVATLQALDDRRFAAGIAELLRIGLAADAVLVDHLETALDRPGGLALAHRLGDLQALVMRAVQVGIDVARDDPFDDDRQKILTLGRPFAQALEQVEAERLIGGEALGLGLIAAARLSRALGHCQDELVERVEQLVTGVGLPTRLPRPARPETVRAAVERELRSVDGDRRFALLEGAGRAVLTDRGPESELSAVLESLQPT